jgi:hypothetical protein
MAADSDYKAFNPDKDTHERLQYQVFGIIEEHQPIKTRDIADKAREQIKDNDPRGVLGSSGKDEVWSKSYMRNLLVPELLNHLHQDNQLERDRRREGGKSTNYYNTPE